MAQRSTLWIDDIVTGGFGTTLARAESHLFPSSSLVESWFALGPLKGWVGCSLHTCTNKRLRVFVSWTCFCRALVCTPRGSLCPSVCTTEFFVGAHWFPPRRGGSAGPSLCLRVTGCACVLRAALASTRGEPGTKESSMRAHFCC